MNKQAITIGTVSLALATLLISTHTAEPRAQTANQIIADARTPISTLPFTINKSGSYFVTRNLTGSSGQNGITITADDVTIDLNGFTLKGVPGSLNGISITNMSKGIQVYGGTVRDFGGSGVTEELAESSTLGAPRFTRSLHDMCVMSNGGTQINWGDGLSLYACDLNAGGGTALTAGDSFEIRDSTLKGTVTLGSGGLADGSSFILEGAEVITLADKNKVSGCHFNGVNMSGTAPAITLGAGNTFGPNVCYTLGAPRFNLCEITGPDNQITHNQFVASGGVTPGIDSVIELASARNVLAHNTITPSMLRSRRGAQRSRYPQAMPTASWATRFAGTVSPPSTASAYFPTTTSSSKTASGCSPAPRSTIRGLETSRVP